jgi:hypothetical protein
LREWDSKKGRLTDDPVVAELRKERDVPRLVAEKVVKEGRRRVITEIASQSKKVHLIQPC